MGNFRASHLSLSALDGGVTPVQDSGHDSADSEIAQKTGQAAVEGTHDNP
jgi:hypothetical protein